MKISRRDVLKTASLATAGAAAVASVARVTPAAPPQTASASALPPAFASLKPLGDRVKPIRAEEYQQRIAHAQELMANSKPQFQALFIAPGTSLVYFTGIHWWPSERILALLIPRHGDPFLVSPSFEEGRLREQLHWPIEIRTWQEDESPFAIAAKTLTDRGVTTGQVGVDAPMYYGFFDRMRQAATSLDFVSGSPVIDLCRAQKSAHELELMRLACSATFDVYKALFGSLKEGMTQREVGHLLELGFAKMNLEGDALVLFGPSAALPHGTHEEQILREGMGILIDGGTTVEGYHSDITRTGVLGKPTDQLQRAFEIVRGAQDAALAAAVAGHECGSVDDAARKVILDAGFGPNYKYFTHRLGHGIGLDEHEYPYLVRGSKITLQPNMTFSNEPGIYVPGEYGLRCEDDMAIAESGSAQLLTAGFQPSLEKPIA
ncbi:MAG TPA: Xaa-Pro peptidase family protein [Candidatus Acidoferrales bacterium]